MIKVIQKVSFNRCYMLDKITSLLLIRPWYVISVLWFGFHGRRTKQSTRTPSDIPVHSTVEVEFGNVGFWGEGKTGVPVEKPLVAEKRTNNKLKPHMTPGLGIEPGTHWWERSALATASSLLPQTDQFIANFYFPLHCTASKENSFKS